MAKKKPKSVRLKHELNDEEVVGKNGRVEKNKLKKDNADKKESRWTQFKKRIKNEDSELQKFGFEWLKQMLTGKSSLMRK